MSVVSDVHDVREAKEKQKPDQTGRCCSGQKKEREWSLINIGPFCSGGRHCNQRLHPPLSEKRKSKSTSCMAGLFSRLGSSRHFGLVAHS